MRAAKCFCLQTLSPIHIGCDEVYEPMSFVLDESGKKLITFDSLDFFRQLSVLEKKALSDICRKGTVASLLEIYKFMRKKRFPGAMIDVCEGFVRHYQRTFEIAPHDSRRIQQELSKFTIARTSFNPNNGRPYIPGSAIKGALRTGYLNLQSGRRRVRTPGGRNAARELETALLERNERDFVATDPFRMLKVSDFLPMGEVKTRIVYAVNRKKKPSRFQAQGPYQIFEVIEPGAVFYGSISVDRPENGSGINNPLKPEELFSSCEGFYTKEMRRENQDISSLGIPAIQTGSGHKISILRVGRHSGAECVTIKGHRNIRIKQGKGQEPKFEKEASTLWLAADSSNPKSDEGLKPFGWVIVQPMEQETLDEIERFEDAARKERFTAIVDRSMVAVQPSIHEGAVGPETSVRQLPTHKPSEQEIWERATLVWRPNDQTVVATLGARKAMGTGKDLVPEILQGRLFKKKKQAVANVVVEKVGNAFRIVRIEVEP